MYDTKRSPKKQISTRQEIVMREIDCARREVIRLEMEIQFLNGIKDRYEKDEVKKSVVDEIEHDLLLIGVKDIDSAIDSYENRYSYWRERLDFYKSLRDENIKKSMIKDAEKTMNSVPNKICFYGENPVFKRDI